MVSLLSRSQGVKRLAARDVTEERAISTPQLHAIPQQLITYHGARAVPVAVAMVPYDVLERRGRQFAA